MVLCLAPAPSQGQAAVEAAGANSVSAGAAASAGRVLPPAFSHPEAAGASAFIPTQKGPTPDEINRKALEQRAGKDAAKLLLQSIPSQAQIQIDGVFVGRTPLLLIIPPGKYNVAMHGPREQLGQRDIDLSPSATQQFTLKLVPRYPSSVTLAMGSASVGSQATVGRPSEYFASDVQKPVTENRLAVTGGQSEASLGEMNRKALQQRAGEDAAILALESVPSDALVYLDGTFVGRTPLQLTVAPGKYKVEMRDEQESAGERLVGLLPNETQRVAVALSPGVPTRVSARSSLGK